MDLQAIGSTEQVQKQQEENAKEEQRQKEELFKMKIGNIMAKLKQPKIKEEEDESYWSEDDE